MRLTRPKAIQRARRDARDQHTTVGTHALADIIGDSPPIERARRLAIRAGQSESPLLIIGESGTGKELLAKAMHEVSRRANGSFIPINCAAIPESLIETALFGYAHGAFTGASREGRPSLFERAHRGRCFSTSWLTYHSMRRRRCCAWWRKVRSRAWAAADRLPLTYA
jgi:transcriptional regulator, propionate catabolism operon regulatory protein